MKKDAWVLYLLVFITSSTTVLTLYDGTFFGLLRGLAIAAVLDGSIVYHEHNGNILKDERQRKWSNGMKWAAVGFLLVIAISYVLTLFVPVDATQNVNLFGMVFSSTIREVIHWTVYAMIGAWVVLTLGVVLFLREIDPDVIRERERKQSVDAAEKTRADKEDDAFKIAMNSIAEMVGQERGILALQKRLEGLGDYSEYEITQLVNIARAKLIEQKTGASPVDAENPFANRYPSTVRDETPNFPKPSTPKN